MAPLRWRVHPAQKSVVQALADHNFVYLRHIRMSKPTEHFRLEPEATAVARHLDGCRPGITQGLNYLTGSIKTAEASRDIRDHGPRGADGD